MKRINRVAVVGAGVNGLTCATLLQDQILDIQVTIISDKFLTDTTSDGAAGIFRPGLSFTGPTEEITRKWLKDSYEFFSNILTEFPKIAEEAGIFKLRAYFLSSKYPEAVKNPYLQWLLPDFRKCTSSELKMYGRVHKYGNTCTTFLIECRKYLPFLMKKFQSRGGTIIKRKLDSFNELFDDFDVIINCSGLGSMSLCNDHTMTSIRGQVFKVNAPWIKDAMYEDYNTYIIPGTTLITLGGTRNYSAFDIDINAHDSKAIWDNCTHLIPSLKNAKIEREWVGHRPYRPYVRVERETRKLSGNRTLEIVHNYGHGGYGVMASPGTSLQAVELAMQCLQEARTKIAKL